MLAEFKHYILAKDYLEMENADTEIYLIDCAAHLLEAMSEKTHQETLQALHHLGVHVKLNTGVANFENDEVHLSDGEIIEAKTLIWAAGVTANRFDGLPNASHGKGHRMKTDEFNCVKGYGNVYAIGDISIQHYDPAYPEGHPQLAQPAIQQGKTLARNLIRIAKGKPIKPFKYFDKGEMAIIGRNLAVADLFKHKLHIGGILGLLSWLFIHVASLVNYNNKIKTLYGWTIAYLTRDQFLRMIFRSENRENRCQSDMEYNRNYQTNEIF